MDVPASKSLKSAIDDKSAVIGILGLGYVGLPLINAFITAGFKTIGFDVDQKKDRNVSQGPVVHWSYQLRSDSIMDQPAEVLSDCRHETHCRGRRVVGVCTNTPE